MFYSPLRSLEDQNRNYHGSDSACVDKSFTKPVLFSVNRRVKYLICGISDSERPLCVVSEGLAAFQGHLVWAVFLLVVLRPVLLTFGLREEQMTNRDV